MTGLELLELVSALSPEQAKRIVFITGGAFTGSIQAVLEATGNPRLEKPFHADRLRELVGGILDARRAVEAGVAAPPLQPPPGAQRTHDARQYPPRVAEPGRPRQAPRSIAAALAA